MGNRTTASVGVETSLSFEFYRSNNLFNAFSVVDVAVYSSEDDAANDTNALFTINPVNVLNPSVGLYKYTIPAISSAGVYYDKIRLIPVENESTISFVNTFEVFSYSGNSGKAVETCLITGSLVDSAGDALIDEVVNFVAQGSPAVDTTTLNGIAPVSVQAYTNSKGYFSIALIKGIEYRVNIRAMGFSGVIKVPVDVNTAVLWSLLSIPTVTTIPNSGTGEPTTPTNGGTTDSGGNNW